MSFGCEHGAGSKLYIPEDIAEEANEQRSPLVASTFIKPAPRPVRPINEVQVTAATRYKKATKAQMQELLEHFSVKPMPGHGLSVEALCPTQRNRSRTCSGKRYKTKNTAASRLSAKSKSKKG